VWAAALAFGLIGLAIQLWRIASLTASYDQGIFVQALWNGLAGHPFESTLSSQLSDAVIHGGLAPQVGYHRLGQHFTPLLALWIPLVGLLGPMALPLVQVGLVTGAGLALHRLAAQRLAPPLAARMAFSFYGANAVLGPTWGNFTDLCQLPLLVFLVLLGLERRRWLLALIPALLIPLVREDTGVVLVGMGVWLALRQPRRWPLALLLMGWGGGWVLLVTNQLMPLFSDDNARRFMLENFGQYVPGSHRASSLEVLRQALAQPGVLLHELFDPPDQTLRYLLGQGLPLLFVPLIAVDSWLLMGLPLLGLLLAQGSNNPLSITIRYTFLVVPGLFAGAVFWWQRHGAAFASGGLRGFWTGAVLLSLLFTLTSNPHRSLSFLVPDSVHPWVHRSLVEQWQHAQAARSALALIPPQSPTAATTHLVPPLARRTVLVRFPESVTYLDRQGKLRSVDWIAADLGRLQRYGAAFNEDRDTLETSLKRFQELGGSYGVRRVVDGVVILERGGQDAPGARLALDNLLKASPPAAPTGRTHRR
jgi:uncharacterized membrane protein